MAVDPRLERRGPLDGLANDLTKASSDAVRIEAVPVRSVVNLRGAAVDESLVSDVQMALGIELPLMPNRWHGDDRVAAVWVGPDEWLIVAPEGAARDIEQGMRELRPNDPWISLVDVSNNYSCVQLSGPGARDVLAKGCALDLRPEGFAPGVCAQSMLAKAPILLRALADADSFELWTRNTYVGYLAAWLVDASAAEVAPGVRQSVSPGKY